MPVEIYCNRKGGIVSEKYREVEFDEDTVRRSVFYWLNSI